MGHPVRPPARARRSRTALLPLCLSVGLLACTKVVEQPVLETPPAPPQAQAPARPRAPQRPAWPSSAPAPAAAPVARETAAPVDTLNGDPNGLKREDLQAALDGAMTRFSGCVDAPGTTQLALSFDADPEGKATNIKVSGGGGNAEGCVSQVAGSLPLPKFTGKAVPVHFPITVQRTVTQQAPAAAAEASARRSAASAPPPVFVKP
jgi:hypothetical protein